MAKKTENEVKETKKEAAVMDEAAKEKFQQKLKDLIFWKQTISMYFGSQMMILMMKFYSM